MPAQPPLYQEILDRIRAGAGGAGARDTSLRRLALLVTGMVAAESAVTAKVAAELAALGAGESPSADSVARRLRRALADRRLRYEACYRPALRAALDWPALLAGRRRVVLIVDESANRDKVHLFRVSLAYWGGALPLAWATWAQNAELPEGAYWAKVDMALRDVAALLPAGVEVVVLADRAYDHPPFVDRLAAHGWHWVVRCKAGGALRFRDRRGREHAVAELVRRHLARPGRRFKARGQVFKKAGWREASLVGVWAPGQAEPLVVLTDLAPRWEVLHHYDRRFWTEPGFRNDKRKGWHWEDSQVKGLAHHGVLLLAMAWASLLALSLGAAVARERLAGLARRRVPRRGGRPRVGKPEHARESVFTMGLRAAGRYFYRTADRPLPWRLPELDARAWSFTWYQAQSQRFLRLYPSCR